MVNDEREKSDALFALSEHIIPNRWAEVRPPTKQELKVTLVLSLPITEASAKIRTGNPIDDDEDYALDVWAGVIPLQLAALPPVSDSRSRKDIETPAYVQNYTRQK